LAQTEYLPKAQNWVKTPLESKVACGKFIVSVKVIKQVISSNGIFAEGAKLGQNASGIANPKSKKAATQWVTAFPFCSYRV
jgi:hypothetical protein